MPRQTWSSRLTYILTVAGATIGFGATWRFPYLVGLNGGGAYVLVFIIVMFLVGIPIILVENVIGRRVMNNCVDAFGINNNKASNLWKIVGYMGLVGAFGILAYYMVIGGWVLSYIANIIMGNFDLSSPISKVATESFYHNEVDKNQHLIALYTLAFVSVNYIILRKGIIEGIEHAVKYLMPLLFICLVVMVIKNLTLDGAMDGVIFYLKPDFSKITPQLFLDVLGQVFFALSLGFGVMITLSSHLNKKENLVKTATITGIVNTLIAVLAGFMIFPSLFSAGLKPDSGPSLVFKTLPIAFSRMDFGNFFAVVFFSLLLIAALTTSITIYQVIISVLYEKFHIKLKVSILLTLSFVYIFGNIPCVLSSGILSDVHILGRNIFDAFDFISGNICFVLTSLGCCLFVSLVLKDLAKTELSNGKSKPYPTIVNIWFMYVRYVLPLVILVIFFYGVF